MLLHGPNYPPDTVAGFSQRGSSLFSLLFWILGLIVFVSPFLRDPAQPTPSTVEDTGRLASEIDIPFREEAGYFQEDYEVDLLTPLQEASEAWFGFDGERLAASGLIERERLEPGQRAYVAFCSGCHGIEGDGGGPAARHLEPRPRNFRSGIFKFTSTDTGTAPTRKDIFQTITRGLSGASMPDFRLLSEETRWDLVEYVRYLAIRGSFEQLALQFAWDEEELPDLEETADIILGRWSPQAARPVYPATPEPPMTEETVARGKEIFASSSGGSCSSCHGEGGRGDGPAAADFLDDWGYPIVPRDLTTGVFRAGSESADLYRSIVTGINGTPMPAYGGSIDPEDIWCIVHFIQSLKEKE